MIAELISSLEIYLSNHQLAKTVEILTQEGYSVVPYGKALLLLSGIFPALAGALFFTCTSGVVVTTSAIILFILCDHFFHNARYRMVIFCTPWILINALLFRAGENPGTIAYLLLIPFTVLLILETVKKKPSPYPSSPDSPSPSPSPSPLNWKALLIAIISMALTISLFYFRCDRGVFLRARDYLLLTNRPGVVLNNFYYNCTLYAAEAIKTPLQKQVKTCWIDPQISSAPKIRTIMARYGWLNIEKQEKASLLILTNNSQLNSAPSHNAQLFNSSPFSSEALRLDSSSKTIVFKETTKKRLPWRKSVNFQAGLEIEKQIFFKNSFHILKHFSKMADDHSVMRMLCFTALVGVLPVLLYLTLFLLLGYCVNTIFFKFTCTIKNKYLSSSVMGQRNPTPWEKNITAILTITSVITVILAAALLNTLYPHQLNFTDTKNKIELKRALTHNDNRVRTEALRNIYSNRHDNIWNYSYAQNGLIKRDSAEKYWLAKNLGISGKEKGIPYLEDLGNDLSINVQCSAIDALGKISGVLRTEISRSALSSSRKIKTISRISSFLEKKMTNADQWYIQRYAYEALQKIKARQL